MSRTRRRDNISWWDVYEMLPSHQPVPTGSCYATVVFASKSSVIPYTSRRHSDESTLGGSRSRVLCPRASLLLNAGRRTPSAPFCHSLPPFSAVNLRFGHASFVGKMRGVLLPLAPTHEGPSASEKHSSFVLLNYFCLVLLFERKYYELYGKREIVCSARNFILSRSIITARRKMLIKLLLHWCSFKLLYSTASIPISYIICTNKTLNCLTSLVMSIRISDTSTYHWLMSFGCNRINTRFDTF